MASALLRRHQKTLESKSQLLSHPSTLATTVTASSTTAAPTTSTSLPSTPRATLPYAPARAWDTEDSEQQDKQESSPDRIPVPHPPTLPLARSITPLQEQQWVASEDATPVGIPSPVLPDAVRNELF